MLSTSKPLTESPMSRVPYDVLLEIFIHCLHKNPEDRIRPKETLLLLCRICSSWRTVALKSATLWTHFSYCLTIIMQDDYDINTQRGSFKFVASQIEYIRWWRINQGPIAPFLDLSVYECDLEYAPENKGLTEDGVEFLIEYITSAQSLLELDAFFWRRIEERIKGGYQVVFPHLHTLIAEQSNIESDIFYTTLSLQPTHSLPSLRHLSIYGVTDVNIPHHWSISTLTHISLWTSYKISLDFWFTLIRGLPNLRWGYFNIDTLSIINYTIPRKYNLLHLTTLLVHLSSCEPREFLFPLSLLFTNLHLPALHTLSLDSINSSWKDHHAITNLYGVLKSTPAITNLVLGYDFLSVRNHKTTEILAAIEDLDVQPIWNYANQLRNLQLDSPSRFMTNSEAEHEEVMDLFVRNIFCFDSGWLDLRNPACPIRSLTIRGESDDLMDFKMTMLKNDVKAPKIVLQLAYDSQELVALREQDQWAVRI